MLSQLTQKLSSEVTIGSDYSYYIYAVENMKIEKKFGGQFLLCGIRHSYNKVFMCAGLIAAVVNTA